MKKYLENEEVKRIFKFAVVGLSGTAIDFAVLAFLIDYFALVTKTDLIIANSISYSTGIINNFYWNRRWTFPETKHSIGKQFVQYASVNLMGLVLDTGIMVVMTPVFAKLLPQFGSGVLIAKTFSTGCIAVWNFIVNRYWTFNDVGAE